MPPTPRAPSKAKNKTKHHGEKAATSRLAVYDSTEGSMSHVKSMPATSSTDVSRRWSLASSVGGGGTSAPADPLEKVKRVFELCDTDKSGTISRRELSLLLQRLGNFSAGDVNRIMQEVDKDESGDIDYDEFLTWISSPGANVGVVDGEAVKFDLETAFKPLWNVFDRNGSGSISHEEFHECYRIMSGALRALPQQDGAPPIASLVSSDEDRIFKIIDKDQDDEISFNEFVEWQREAIQHSGISQQQLVGLVQKLSCLLQDVFMFSGTKRRKDDAAMEQDPIMKALLPKVAVCSRELWRRTANKKVDLTKGESKDGKEAEPAPVVEWPSLPKGLDTHKLVRRHLQDPVPTQGVKKIDVRIHSLVPDLTGEHGLNGEPPRWLAKVIRTLTHTDGYHQNVQYYYSYRAESWTGLEVREQFYKALMMLPSELRLYSLLLAEADFGTSLKWPQVQLVMEDAKKMGLLSTEEFLEYNISIEKAMLKELDKKRLDPDALVDLEKKKEALATLMPQAKFSPVEVMQTLTAYGIMPVHPLWATAADS